MKWTEIKFAVWKIWIHNLISLIFADQNWGGCCSRSYKCIAWYLAVNNCYLLSPTKGLCIPASSWLVLTDACGGRKLRPERSDLLLTLLGPSLGLVGLSTAACVSVLCGPWLFLNEGREWTAQVLRPLTALTSTDLGL